MMEETDETVGALGDASEQVEADGYSGETDDTTDEELDLDFLDEEEADEAADDAAKLK